MSFAVSASTTRVVASARAPVKARNATVAAFAAPVASKASAAKLAARHATAGVALRATGASTVARAGRNMRVLAGRFEAERTYIMIKPDGVQRGYVRSHARLSAAIATAGFSPFRPPLVSPPRRASCLTRVWCHRAKRTRVFQTAAMVFRPSQTSSVTDEKEIRIARGRADARGRGGPPVDASSRTARTTHVLTRTHPMTNVSIGTLTTRRLATSCPASRRRASC